MKTHAELLAIVEAQKEKGPRLVQAEKSVEEMAAIPTRFPILNIIRVYETPRQVWVQRRAGNQAPAMLQDIRYGVNAYKSSARDEIGKLTDGVGIELYGYLMVVDGNGLPTWEKVPNPGFVKGVSPDEEEFLEVPLLITEDEEGNPLEPQRLMTFRPQWGTDFSKPEWKRPKDIPVLNLVPGDGVPRKGRIDVPAIEGQAVPTARVFEQIDWNKIANLETEMKASLLNAETEGDTDMLEFISYIPMQANFGKKAEAKGYTPPSAKAAKVAENVPEDAFAGTPDK